ncbi:Putative collagen-binding domain of a collagenase [Verrucomicrobium sp. GAS474]|uniref:apiosidase-like domain-containing protein n=1 Tax=Verrucomicrobium sp. GAS474 TaxID=1882831 RepID=UPI00087BE3DE|nr:DUF4038 domain-containing protein [Verrucomicrobium sp. GAS474]SDU02746.1 Putative collagen-binding domain of a collagenase [Verrucomicrobium sp. GAS474]
MPFPPASDALAKLSVDPSGRFLAQEDGRPYLWIGDTAWELFHRLTDDEAGFYLKTRAAQGFTLVQAVALSELGGPDTPNARGDLPFVAGDPLRPNEPYWAHIDAVVARANELGLRVGLLPTWGSYWQQRPEGKGFFDAVTAEAYGEWIGTRYREAGLAWILGGDRVPSCAAEIEIVERMACGLRRGDRGTHLMTFHTRGDDGSSAYFHDAPWLDFNCRQNGHAVGYPGRYEKTLADYRRLPAKPVIDGEPVYEEIPIDLDTAKPYANDTDIRRAAYWNLISGAFGHTYGHHSVWQMWEPGRGLEPVYAPRSSWREALFRPGATQIGHLRRLLASRAFLPLVPHPEMAEIPNLAAVPASSSGVVAYAPFGGPLRLRTGAIPIRRFRAWRFDPRTGETSYDGTFENVEREGGLLFPATEEDDWVLVLDDAAKGALPPGSMS